APPSDPPHPSGSTYLMTFDPSQDQPFSPTCQRRRTIAFTSGKGGVGKSNLVLNTGLLLARHGQRVALLDGDLGLANLTVLMGQAPKYDLRDVLAGDKGMRDIVMEGPNGLRVIPARSVTREL